MTWKNDFTDLVERAKLAEKEGQDLWLGRLTWYSFSDVRVSHNDVVRALITNGISSNLPLPPRDADVFRRVSTENQRKKEPTANADVFENYLVRELSTADDDYITRRVVVEQVDRKGKKLDYESVLDVRFNRKTSDITWVPLPGAYNPIAGKIAVKIKQDFALWQGHLTTYAIREWTRNYIEGPLRGTKVRPGGGVYFVSEDFAKEVDGLEAFVRTIAGIQGNCDFHSLPLVDDRKQREMLQRAFEAETADAIDDMLTKITEIKSSGKKITTAAYEAFVADYQRLVERTQEYSNLLEEKLTGASSRLEVYQQSMVSLLAQVKH